MGSEMCIRDRAFEVLAVKRNSGKTERFTLEIDPVVPGDSLILFGTDDSQDALSH